ncbi:DUF2637 domain-containing protein [Lentzea tibetensis]|uniref:DUF2637 domain-containing protein n=1 Tax=Lentzea tibetensis TaxID=2591470 RepID=A0A563EUX6_9PSEU|nr:DUF2637 domain-containing protein [Lentzea tibetensis]TWP51469.1 DUF2637 domain-containing protein [Lentzea tibetensis]
MSTTFYTGRAERTMAAAMAEQHKAAAEAQRAETALRLFQVQREHELAADELAERRAARRRADRRAARAERSAQLSRALARVPDWLLSALWAAVIVAPITLAWRAQQAFAVTTLHVPAGWSWLFPLAVEAGAWVCAFEAHRRARRGAPIGSLLTWMWLLSGIAAGIQLGHATTDYGPVAGVALAAMSLLGVLLHHIRSTVDRAAVEGRTSAELRRAAWRRVRFPRLSWAAASIAAARGAGITADQAWTAAWTDRYGVGPDSSRRDRSLARVIVRHQHKADREAARNGGLVIVGGVILPVTVPVLESAGIAAPPTVDTVSEVPADESETGIVQAQLPEKTAQLLIKVRSAVAAGELPARPSASAIRAMFKGASETASDVRDLIRKEAA